MPLPTPNLDDRRFQDLVDQGKRLVQQKCPEWSDHNVSDPGVTMIEIFAWMTDQLIYRLNQVPDRLFLKFLDLLGYELAPPSAAEADVTFWLSAPQTDTVSINPGVEVSTVRAENKAAISFTVTEQLDIIPLLARVPPVDDRGGQVPVAHRGARAQGRQVLRPGPESRGTR